MRVTRTGLLTGAALVAGLVLAAMLGMFYLMGDCWSVNDTPEAIQACEVSKRAGVFAFLLLAGGTWLAGLVFALRGRPFAKRLGLLSGPAAFVAASVFF